MWVYLSKRLLLLIFTLWGILTITFLVMQLVPGGPLQTLLAELKATALPGGEVGTAEHSLAQGGLSTEQIAQLQAQLGMDLPLWQRYWQTLANYLTFDLGESLFQQASVWELIIKALPVSMSLGLWTFFFTYLISIPLGIAKAMRHGTPFDAWTSTVILIGYAIPGFLLAVALLVLFGGGSFVQWFPLSGLTSDHWQQLPWPEKILDYLWHLTLPLIALLSGSFAVVTMLTKNSFLEEIGKTYVLAARARGFSDRRVLYGQVFRNAMIPIVTGFPAAFIGAFFAGSLLIETIFSLEGLGLLGYEAVMKRDYPVVLGTLYVFTLLGLLAKLLTDILYVVVDPRIAFDASPR